jgi:hypothetical protein
MILVLHHQKIHENQGVEGNSSRDGNHEASVLNHRILERFSKTGRRSADITRSHGYHILPRKGIYLDELPVETWKDGCNDREKTTTKILSTHPPTSSPRAPIHSCLET